MQSGAVGKHVWVVPEGYLPDWSHGPEPEPEPVPRATDFASVVESDVPVVVHHTRLDSRQEANALMTTLAWPA